MSYRLRAVVADLGILAKMAGEAKGVHVADLAHGLGLIPLTEAAEKAVPPAPGGAPFKGLKATAALAAWAAKASQDGPVGYVEADYGDGKDFQGAVLWSGGKVTAGPWTDATAWDPREDARERPVNGVLRLLGVGAGGFNDEWDAVGLARHTDTKDW